MKLIQTKDYLLLIDEEAEIKEGDKWIYDKDNPSIIPLLGNTNIVKEGISKGWFVKIIAHYPLTKEATELDLLELPNPFGDYSIDRAKEFAIDRYQDVFEKHPRGGKLTIDTLRDVIEVSVETGYRFAIKESQSKQFSLEDIKKAIEMAREMDCSNYDYYGYCEKTYTEEEIIQSLSTQQLPKEFIISDKFSTFEGNIKNGKYKW